MVIQSYGMKSTNKNH